MLTKITFILVAIVLFGCDGKTPEDQIPYSNQTGERKSIHQQDSENNSQASSNDKFVENYEIVINKIQTITEKSLGSFNNPQFTIDGKNLIFTTQDYSQLWLYNLDYKTIEKIVALPECGSGYQVSKNNDDIYFRNRAKQGRKGGVYSILKYSVSSKKMDVVYKSENRITTPLFFKDNIYFLEKDIPKRINLMNMKVDSNFNTPFFYVENNLLIRVSEVKDTISFPNKNFKFIACKYSRDGEYIIVLTAKNGMLVLDLNAKPINQYKHAISLSKLYQSNLVVYSDQKDDGQKILSSELSVGFINSSKKIVLNNAEKELRLNPDWSPTDNKIVYSTDDGLIKIISFNIEKKSK